ncbi:hypothetical protein [Bradyrhizobium sp. RDI18]|uniref:hypothetical protein n=1 Tax=Bradyrhizobium sp. RDI18 TaxID=3367400 RepID=UPI00371B5182
MSSYYRSRSAQKESTFPLSISSEMPSTAARAAWTSIQIGIAVTIRSTIVGTPADYGLDRAIPRLRSTLTMAILAPIALPSCRRHRGLSWFCSSSD